MKVFQQEVKISYINEMELMKTKILQFEYEMKNINLTFRKLYVRKEKYLNEYNKFNLEIKETNLI